MQLIIDVGNTKVKLAIFKEATLKEKREVVLEHFTQGVIDLVKSYPVTKAIISSVGRLTELQCRSVQNRFPTIILNHKTSVPFINEYDTPETLGVDRIGLISAFAKAYPGKNGLIIDAGTCITYDFITSRGVYKGGAISPGIRLRYTSLHSLTANLPLLETRVPKSFIGTSTESSMHSGVVNGVVQEINGVIAQYKEEYGHVHVILTGGDAQILSERLKNSIFAHSNFLLEGLNYILNISND
ncbi:type III pantothenate kinase [Dokdonia sinensis]|uniref:Type III pantothenate kinase n=1 Tax=Dokdonia sinensis TaxID=2479847 RepID=A0A3M0G574_9FLAO|nr:type III pantothenate kinase [Dokdonia sinensis]RMB59217.1 type III pantothenate kinase [Dokdonia sinensis]